MTSNGSVKEFILITNDEYCFMKNQAQNEIKSMDYRQKQKQQILAQIPASQEYTSSLEKQSEAVTSQAIDKERALIAQINLNSRLQDQNKSNRETSIPQENNDRPENNTPDKVLGSLLQSGIARGKTERSRQILKSIQKNDRVSIDENNQNIFVDQQDTSINIIDFLTALQVNTKQLPKQFLNLGEILALPQFPLANTYAWETSSRIQNRSEHGDSPRKRIKLDTDPPSSWLTIWV